MIWNLLSCCLAFILPNDAIQAYGRENYYKSYRTVNLVSYKNNWNGKMCHECYEGNQTLLIVFKTSSTGSNMSGTVNLAKNP